MSLINEMLRDLEVRRKQEQRSSPCCETPVVVGGENVSPRLLLLAGGIVLLIGVVWVALTLISRPLLPNPVDTNFSVQATAVPAIVTVEGSAVAVISKTGEKLRGETVAPVQDAAQKISASIEAELSNLEVFSTDHSVRLSLSFARLPEYRLLQNGLGAAQLVVSFSHARIGENFEIPQLPGTIVKRVSLLPEKQNLQLLVDLDTHAQVQSFQLVEKSTRDYRLLIDIAVPVVTVEKPQKQQPVSATVQHKDAAPANQNVPAKSRVSKNNNLLQRDQQAYQAGLKQLKKQDWVAAEASFYQALIMTPEMVEARLQLVAVLQRQMKLDKMEEVLQQGLSLTPGNYDLRKNYARLLLQEQRQSEAIKLLKTAPVPAVARDLEYHALLAALYQETGQFLVASSIYSQLVQLRPQEALWWMGMGISLDQAGQTKDARNAYQKALTLPALRPDLQTYIRERLQQLQSG